MSKFFSMRALGNGVGEVRIYGPIGDSWFEESVSPASFWAELEALGEVSLINVYINSPGGSVFDGMTIANQLKRHPAKIHSYIEGLAASMASLIAVIADRRYIYDSAMIMIHNPSGGAYGEAEELRKYAETLDKVRETGANMYAQASGQSVEDILGMMDAETWMTAGEAEELGFVDEVISTVAAAASTKAARSFDLSMFQNLPQALKPAAQPQPLPKGENTVSKKSLLTSLAAAVVAKATTDSPRADLITALAAASEIDAETLTQSLDNPSDESPLSEEQISGLEASLKALPVAQQKPGNPVPAPAPSPSEPMAFASMADAYAAGQQAERARIQGVQSQALPGHDELIAEMMFDGKTSPEQAAIRVLNAERAALQAGMQGRRDATNPAPRPPVNDAGTSVAADSFDHLPEDERIKAQWDANEKLRAEFGGNFESYAAYTKANNKGLVKVLNK